MKTVALRKAEKKKKAPKMPTRPATEIKSKGPKSLVTKPTKKKRTVVKYRDKDGSKVKSVERRSGKLIETRKKKGEKDSSYKSKKITNKDGSVKVKTSSKGIFDVEVDGKSYPVKGKKVVKTRRDKTVTKFKARGGKDTPIRKINDKHIKKKGLTKMNKKKTKYRKMESEIRTKS